MMVSNASHKMTSIKAKARSSDRYAHRVSCIVSFTPSSKIPGLRAAVAAAAWWRPSWGESGFRKVEELGRSLARHRTATWLGLGLLVLLVRGALLPLWPIPKPVIYDEFSYLLQADTFAHGRLTNPTHKLWPFFEGAYVLQHPTYASKYPPAQSLAMAAGQAVWGDPWFGVWLSCGVMMAALVWAMQGWMPPGWALVGGLLAMPLAIVSYWMNSYWGGAVSAIGGALLLGGYARVVRRKQIWYAVAMGIGIAILANTRPYEGLVYSIPVAIAYLLARPRWGSVVVLAAVLIPAFAATGYYNRAVTGNAFELPFTEYARQYVYIPLFNFEPLQASKVYRTPVIYDLHQNWEREQWGEGAFLAAHSDPTGGLEGCRIHCSGQRLAGAVADRVPGRFVAGPEDSAALDVPRRGVGRFGDRGPLLHALRRSRDGGAIHRHGAGAATSSPVEAGGRTGRTSSGARPAGTGSGRGHGFAGTGDSAPGTSRESATGKCAPRAGGPFADRARRQTRDSGALHERRQSSRRMGL